MPVAAPLHAPFQKRVSLYTGQRQEASPLQSTHPGEVTTLLQQVSKGDCDAAGKLIPFVPDELRQVASLQLQREAQSHPAAGRTGQRSVHPAGRRSDMGRLGHAAHPGRSRPSASRTEARRRKCRAG